MSHKNYNVCVTAAKYIFQVKWSKDIFWWVDPEMSLSHLRNIFLCWHDLRIYFVKEMW